jgi:hypothetical protein
MKRQAEVRSDHKGNKEWTFKRLTDNDRPFIDNIRLEIKTRTDAVSSTIPEKLYSSLKYQFTQTLRVRRDQYEQQPNSMVFCNIKVVDPNNGVTILKNDKPILEGRTSSITLIRDKRNNDEDQEFVALTCKTKLEFGDCSYHFKRMHFSLRCEYFLPSDPNNFLVVATSAPFQVFARRVKRHIDDERDFDHALNNNELDLETEEPPQKKARTNKKQVSLNEYKRVLNELIQFKDKLNANERKIAIESAIKRLLPADEMLQQQIIGDQLYQNTYYPTYGELVLPQVLSNKPLLGNVSSETEFDWETLLASSATV